MKLSKLLELLRRLHQFQFLRQIEVPAGSAELRRNGAPLSARLNLN